MWAGETSIQALPVQPPTANYSRLSALRAPYCITPIDRVMAMAPVVVRFDLVTVVTVTEARFLRCLLCLRYRYQC